MPKYKKKVTEYVNIKLSPTVHITDNLPNLSLSVVLMKLIWILYTSFCHNGNSMLCNIVLQI